MAQYKAKILAGKHRKHKILCKIQIIRNNTTRYSIFFCFGKDEVGGSNPPSSSKRNPRTITVLGFFFLPECFAYAVKTDTKTDTGRTKADQDHVS